MSRRVHGTAAGGGEGQSRANATIYFTVSNVFIIRDR